MRIASIILPTHDNGGSPLNDFHHALKSCLIDTFGGFTAITSEGGWRDGETGKIFCEPVIHYNVAMDVSADNRDKLESIARFYGHATGQIAVMVIHADGDVSFVNPVFILESV